MQKYKCREKHLFRNDISPHFKFLLSNERLDFCDIYFFIKDQKDYSVKKISKSHENQSITILNKSCLAQ